MHGSVRTACLVLDDHFVGPYHAGPQRALDVPSTGARFAVTVRQVSFDARDPMTKTRQRIGYGVANGTCQLIGQGMGAMGATVGVKENLHAFLCSMWNSSLRTATPQVGALALTGAHKRS